MITFVQCNIFERIWYIEFILVINHPIQYFEVVGWLVGSMNFKSYFKIERLFFHFCGIALWTGSKITILESRPDVLFQWPKYAVIEADQKCLWELEISTVPRMSGLARQNKWDLLSWKLTFYFLSNCWTFLAGKGISQFKKILGPTRLSGIKIPEKSGNF